MATASFRVKGVRRALIAIGGACLLAQNAFSGLSPQIILVEENTGFAIDLYGQLRSHPGNLFFSPYSISTCLAMGFAGARGETAKQMAHALYLNVNQEQVHSAFGDLQ